MGQAAHTEAENKDRAALAAAANRVQVDLAGRRGAASKDRVAREADRRQVGHRVAAMGRLIDLAALVDTRESSWAWSAARRMALRRMARRAALASGLQRDSWGPRVCASSLNMYKNNAHCARILRRRDHHTRACNIRQLLRESPLRVLIAAHL